jgi:hypothetical protein
MEFIFWLLLSETAVALALIIIFLLLLIWILLGKTVLVPSVTVVTDKPQYARSETVAISGAVLENGIAQPGVPVDVKVTDPNAIVTDLGTVTTDANGKYSVNFPIDPAAAGGNYNVAATALGVTATTTFTFKRSKCSIPEECEKCVVKRSCPTSPFYPYDERGFPKAHANACMLH